MAFISALNPYKNTLEFARQGNITFLLARLNRIFGVSSKFTMPEKFAVINALLGHYNTSQLRGDTLEAFNQFVLKAIMAAGEGQSDNPLLTEVLNKIRLFPQQTFVMLQQYQDSLTGGIDSMGVDAVVVRSGHEAASVSRTETKSDEAKAMPPALWQQHPPYVQPCAALSGFTLVNGHPCRVFNTPKDGDCQIWALGYALQAHYFALMSTDPMWLIQQDVFRQELIHALMSVKEPTELRHLVADKMQEAFSDSKVSADLVKACDSDLIEMCKMVRAAAMGKCKIRGLPIEAMNQVLAHIQDVDKIVTEQSMLEAWNVQTDKTVIDEMRAQWCQLYFAELVRTPGLWCDHAVIQFVSHLYDVAIEIMTDAPVADGGDVVKQTALYLGFNPPEICRAGDTQQEHYPIQVPDIRLTYGNQHYELTITRESIPTGYRECHAPSGTGALVGAGMYRQSEPGASSPQQQPDRTIVHHGQFAGFGPG